MSTNIEGLSQLIEALDRKIQLVNRRLDMIDIQGGDNVLVSRTGEKFVIDSFDKGGETIKEECPWDVKLTPVAGSDPPKYDVSTNGGTINGLLPENFQDCGQITVDSQYWIYWEAELNGDGVTNLKLGIDREEPDTHNKFKEEALPTNVKGLVALIDEGSIAYQFACKNLNITPTIAYQITDPNNYAVPKTFFTWSISEV